MFEPILFKGKELIETGHFKEEIYYKYRKNLDLVEDILELGVHRKESKNKMIATMPTKDGTWELVYSAESVPLGCDSANIIKWENLDLLSKFSHLTISRDNG